MNVFRISLKLRPVEDVIQLRGIEHGYANAWVVSDEEAEAYEVATRYFSKYGWIVDKLEASERVPEERLSLFEIQNKAVFQQMIRHGVVAEIYSLPDGSESHDNESPRYLNPVDC